MHRRLWEFSPRRPPPTSPAGRHAGHRPQRQGRDGRSADACARPGPEPNGAGARPVPGTVPTNPCRSCRCRSLDVGGAAKDCGYASCSSRTRRESLGSHAASWGNHLDCALICKGLGGGSGSGCALQRGNSTCGYPERPVRISMSNLAGGAHWGDQGTDPFHRNWHSGREN